MNLFEQIAPTMDPKGFIQITLKVVTSRYLKACKDVEKGETLEDVVAAMQNRDSLHEFQKYLAFCMHLPETSRLVGERMKSAYIKIQDPLTWVNVVREMVREVAISRPPNVAIH